jgi:hypothetical protein
MSAASENRYRAFAARQAQAQAGHLSHNEALVRDLNAIPKASGAPTPFGDVHFVHGHNGWWAECPTTGFGYWFKTLRKAAAAFNVAIFIDGNRLIGQPVRNRSAT